MASIAEPGSGGRTHVDGRGIERGGAVRRSVPGDLVSGACMVLAPIVSFLSAASFIGIYHAMGDDFVAAMAEHHTRAGVAVNLQALGMVLMIFAVLGLAGMIAAEHPTLGRVGGVLTVLGLLGPIFFGGVYFGGYQLAAPPTQPAAAAMIDNAHLIPRTVMNVAGPALVVGFIVLAVGAARARVLDRPRAIALGLTCLIPVGFISGLIAISAVAFALTAIALVPLGLRTLTGSEAAA